MLYGMAWYSKIQSPILAGIIGGDCACPMQVAFLNGESPTF